MQDRSELSSAASGEPGLVSCLCVTEDRPGFLPWLGWNYAKQDYAARELVLVDSSGEPAPVPEGAAVTVIRCPPGTSVARKRNLAVEASRGSVLTWFDDDDWQHPGKLTLLTAALGGGEALAGSRRSWFVDLHRGRARPHDSQRSVVFNGLGVRRDALDGVRFDERRARAADTAWIASVRRGSHAAVRVLPQVLSLWLCHTGNISNPASRYVFPHPLAAVAEAVGEAAWGDTGAELERLRARLGAG
jgi:hypothetical protein